MLLSITLNTLYKLRQITMGNDKITMYIPQAEMHKENAINTRSHGIYKAMEERN
jgi:hypothetical protein